MNANLSPDVSQCLELLRTMHLIRNAEERLAADFRDGKLPGGVHLSIGQEAVAAGVCAHLDDGDGLASTHRGHGHFLAKGGDPRALFAEVHGKREGICRGMGGSMHVADLSRGIIGANGIVGAGLPIATGAALANQLDDDGRITVCIFGDGASNQGKRCERTTLVFSLTPGRSSRAGVRGSGIEDDRRRSSPACS